MVSPVAEGATISLPLRAMRHVVAGAELVHQPLALDAQLRLQRAGRIVDPGVDHAAVVRARVEAGLACRSSRQTDWPPGGELRGAGEADDPRADDDDVDLELDTIQVLRLSDADVS